MCIIEGTAFTVMLSAEPGRAAWQVYHVVKHVLAEDAVELYNVLDLSSQDMQRKKKILAGQYGCPVLRDKEAGREPAGDMCRGCACLQKCHVLLSDMIIEYTKYLKAVIRHDHHNPRHIHYASEQTTDNLGFLSDTGVFVITKNIQGKPRHRLLLKTGYRPAPPPAQKTMAAGLMKKFSDRYYFTRGRDVIWGRIRRGTYSSTALIDEKNW
ncbi:MAG: hypothetical protein JW832_06720 [Deltaproteobacteria bacterium]|nr:hypothetical protein [Deltaproteobacteria bacterium]